MLSGCTSPVLEDADLSLKIKSFCLGPLANKGYALWDEETTEAIVIDPPMDSEVIASFINKEGLKLTKILNTHCHFDHIGGNAVLKNYFGAKLYIHKKELELLTKGALHAEHFGLDIDPSPPPDGFLSDGDTIRLGKDSVVTVLETPGHTPGGLSFYTGKFLFSGDTLFEGSIGRTDLEGGDFDLLLNSIRTKLFVLPAETRVYPGHGIETTIGKEIGLNPFVGNDADDGRGRADNE
jgi:hydroxyacylglutathione hydrolase